ncbi:SDR family oxidoreductase [Convivina praedatoris]|uniref:Uncharacterized protein n=1 Tax=Convivina praedatoris TaxID=2880963 RepID=A0ABN8HCN0_9LACO|nr:SDR family oxidoreductase [Convivina sp. LMG 32447]CAH1851795.1 hypothetical protein R077815_00403 [Convivina sp. LMG 32447]CAH1853882.1 hypothetical protein LMG032447_00735 [Convivina sp. LMG 32447]CAH1854200.1 hypothetical protein R078138_00827 [Convivina sp. LMG 32447]
MDNNILITGGTSGVGLAIARSLASKPVKLILLGRNSFHAQIMMLELQNKTANVSYYLADLTDESSRQELIKQLVIDNKKIDTVFDCVGIYPKNKEINITVNLTSHYFFLTELNQCLADNSRIFIVTGFPNVVKYAPILDFQSTLINRALWEITYKSLLVSLLAQQLGRKSTVNGFYPGHIQSNLRPHSQKNIQNTLPIASYLLFSKKLNGITNALIDYNGKQIMLNAKKYNYKKAYRYLKKYLPI